MQHFGQMIYKHAKIFPVQLAASLKDYYFMVQMWFLNFFTLPKGKFFNKLQTLDQTTDIGTATQK